ncbi:glycosyltransferase family 4 protein [Actinomadura darangshiensis]|uniref:Glycosyltransferase family 4 protein n=1 Tax=Actinomadura darangshiensis TaxID=705336 RepID=A0A4R5BSQ7_9ACTN|nr:glycosyltransferase [Actinomadura darangshiensis]TDD88310.1 glycosyltransferase family 4 protein [Actinomadura darangshiensis]
MAAPRDVFIVCNNADDMGGLQRWAHHMARLLTGRGDRVTLVGITRGLEPYHHGRDGSYAGEVLHDEWRPPVLAWRPRKARQRLNMAARGRDLWRASAQRRGAARLSELFAAAGPGSVVIVAQVWAMEWVRRADTSGLRVVAMSHESYQATRRSSRFRRVKEHYAGADRMLALTAEDADAWARAGMTNVDHIPNALHVTPGVHPTLDLPVVTCVGRLSYEKGMDLMLEAWERITGRHPEWRLHIYGSGPDEEDLRARAAASGASGSVEFRGVVSDVEEALVEASVFALPSRAEGFPMSVLEAMAYGLPTVAFDCAPGVRALIGDERDGLLARPGDVAAFAGALDRLIESPELRRALGAEARASVLRFHPDAVLARWDRLFDLLHRDLPVAAPDPAPAPAPASARAPAVPRVPAAEAEPALEGDSF